MAPTNASVPTAPLPLAFSRTKRLGNSTSSPVIRSSVSTESRTHLSRRTVSHKQAESSATPASTPRHRGCIRSVCAIAWGALLGSGVADLPEAQASEKPAAPQQPRRKFTGEASARAPPSGALRSLSARLWHRGSLPPESRSLLWCSANVGSRSSASSRRQIGVLVNNPHGLIDTVAEARGGGIGPGPASPSRGGAPSRRRL